MDMNLGLTRQIIAECEEQQLLRNEAAYVLATAYWESARTMQPVKEAFWLSEDWRKRNLRYFPWYGRGLVQLTWEANYRRADEELGLGGALLKTPNKVMEPDISVRILVIGMREGWFTGKKLSDYINLRASNYVGARRIINGTDKAQAIAEIARDYEQALLAEGYGIDPAPPIANEGRDGQAPRSSLLSSTTLQAAGVSAASVVGGGATIASSLGREAQIILAVTAGIAVLGLLWIARERIKKWSEGVR